MMAWHDQHLDHNKKRDIISIRLNAEERQQLEQLKRLLQIKQDGTCLKLSMELMESVLHSELMKPFTKFYLKRYNRKV